LLIAYCYDGKGDSVNAKGYLTQYFAKQKADAFVANDYKFLGKIQSKFPTDSAASVGSYMKAIQLDTVLADKLQIIKDAAADAKAGGHKLAYAYWLGVGYPFIKTPVNTDLYNWGIANYQAGNYKTSDSIFCGMYTSQYPNEIFGYLWCARSKAAQDDSTNSQGLAVDAYQKLGAMARSLDSTAKSAGSADSIKYRSQAVASYFYMASYSNDIKHDKQAAIFWMEQVLAVDPTNATASKIIGQLTKKPAPAARPKAAGAK